MSDAATPVVENEPNTPTPTPATPAPAAPAPAAPAAQPTEKVTLTKEEHDQLARDAARARTLQSKADRYDRIIGKGGHFTPQSQAPATPPSAEELAEKAKAEDAKAERGLIGLAVQPKYRELLDSDPTLREMLTKNPLALLPTLAPDALDAEDAIALVSEALDKRVEGAKKPETPAPTPAPATPPAGGVNPQTDLPNKEAEEALKNPNTEQAVAGSLKARLKGMGGKSS